jgi:hypothetical protein
MSEPSSNARPRPEVSSAVAALTAGVTGQVSGTWFSGMIALGWLERNTTATLSAGRPSGGIGGHMSGLRPGVTRRAACVMSRGAPPRAAVSCAG